MGDRAGEGATLNNIGMVQVALGQNQLALECFQQALAIRREVGDRFGEGATLWNLGDVLERLAETVLSEAVTALKAGGNPQADQAQMWLDRVRRKLGSG